MPYPIPPISIQYINLVGKFISSHHRCDSNHLTIMNLQGVDKDYKICIPINSIFFHKISDLVDKVLDITVLACTTKNKTRYSLVNINKYRVL